MYNGKKEKKNNIVVYTAIFDFYDDLETPSHRLENCDLVCFTDDPQLKSGFFDIRLCKRIFIDPARDSKMYKILPHYFFPDYEYSVWIDGSVIIKTDDIYGLVKKYLDRSDWAVFSHPKRDCIYDEMEICSEMLKDDPEIMKRQMEKYKEAGYPAHNGLVQNTMLLRRHNSPAVIRVDEDWWREVEMLSNRDQLSFNYAAWKNNFQYELMDGSVRNNKYFNWIGSHKQKTNLNEYKLKPEERGSKEKEIQQMKKEIAYMRSSKFWKIREKYLKFFGF